MTENQDKDPLEEIYKHRKKIWPLLKELWKKLVGVKTPIAFTGLPGAGKTVLFDYLTCKAYEEGYKPPGQSINPETGDAFQERKKKAAITVVPGDQRSQRLQTLKEVFGGSNHVSGVVHVVSNGFLQMREDRMRAFMEEHKINSIQDYRELIFKMELDDLRETCFHIKNSVDTDTPVWMLVAMTKMDLYSDALELEQANSYYSPYGKGEFVDIIKKLTREVGTVNFQWDSLPVCGCLENFECNGEITQSKISQEDRNQRVAEFLHKMVTYCGY